MKRNFRRQSGSRAGVPFTCACTCATWHPTQGFGEVTTYVEGQITSSGNNCDSACPTCPPTGAPAPQPVLTQPSMVKRRR